MLICKFEIETNVWKSGKSLIKMLKEKGVHIENSTMNSYAFDGKRLSFSE